MVIRNALRLAAAALMVVATMLVAPSPAQAAIRCSTTIDPYQNRYEVVFSGEVRCTEMPENIEIKMQLYKPVVRNVNRVCDYAVACYVAVYHSNLSGFQDYCATARGFYRLYRTTDYIALPAVSRCIRA